MCDNKPMPKKYFVAYRFSGEDPQVLEERMRLVVDALIVAGIDAYCNIFDQHEYEANNVSPKEIMAKAFAKIDESDGLFALVASNDRSEGQLIEVGYATARQKHIIVAAQADVKTYVDAMADVSLRWNDLTDLKQQLERITV
jgi:hypothetical protein